MVHLDNDCFKIIATDLIDIHSTRGYSVLSFNRYHDLTNYIFDLLPT